MNLWNARNSCNTGRIYVKEESEGRSRRSRGLKARVLAALLAEIACSNLARGMFFVLVSVVCCQVEIPATVLSLIQRSHTERVCVCVWVCVCVCQ
jgi:hypothetical protein